ncbi:MAG: hypothetical protein C0598_01835 [Marinilabiliales bacterium]|nr:MAG: hypothetical protein C0598_01835 [Marinilabiliales bacterium]
MPNYNLHQHSVFSDGKEEPLNYVEKAIELNFTAVGFTEHSPLPFNTPFSLKEDNIQNYIDEIDFLKKKFSNKLEIYRALEMDFVPYISEDFEYWRKACKTDYLIGSVHLVSSSKENPLWFTDGPDPDIYDQGLEEFFGGDIKKAVTTFYHQTNQMIETQEFDVIGHFDKIKMHNANRFFTDEDVWYRKLIDETIELIKSKNLIAEINTRGLYKKRCDKLFPDDYALYKLKENNIPILISSDAHKAHEINELFPQTVVYLKNIGFREMMMFSNDKWEITELN